MTVELRDPIGDLAVHAAAVADSALSSLFALYSAGASNGLDPGPLVVGGGAGGVAGGAAAGSGSGTTGGPHSDPMRNPRLPGPEDDVGDATSPNQQLEQARDGASLDRGTRLIDISRTVQKWAESFTGTDIIGTVPAGGRA